MHMSRLRRFGASLRSPEFNSVLPSYEEPAACADLFAIRDFAIL
jgi:hypothetical protein